MSKSGLADSPFFAPIQPKVEPITPPSVKEPEKSLVEKDVSPIPDSPTLEIPDATIPQSQNEENQDQKRSNERTLERPTERSNERLNERPPKPKREKIRHTFDIYKDQLIDLQRIQWERVQAGKKKPKLGRMVSEGIDLYIKQQASKKSRA